MVKNNLVKGFTDQGFTITSDPTWFNSFGERGLFAYGKNVDSYCNNKHLAMDLAKYHGADIRTPVNCTVLNGTGWNTFGWTGVFGFIDGVGKWRQFIIGHLNQNPLNFLKIGQVMKKGDVIGHQGTSNNLNVQMASHLHMQVQNYASLDEWNFTCNGLNPYAINISNSKPTSGKISKSSKGGWKKNKYGTWWKMKSGTFTNGNEPIQAWSVSPSTQWGRKAGKLPPKAKINFDEILLQDGLNWLGYTAGNGIRLYLPIRKWNKVAPPKYSVGKAWGTLKWK